VTGLGTSQRRGADDDEPSASASRGQRALGGGVAAPERDIQAVERQLASLIEQGVPSHDGRIDELGMRQIGLKREIEAMNNLQNGQGA